MPLVQKGVALAAGRMPQVLKPRGHAVVDYVMAGMFFTATALYWRRNKRAAISSLICGGISTANSLLTDFPGGVWKVISFQTHGKLDAGLAALSATMPQFMSFEEDDEARFFTVLSLAETAVTAMTDFDYYEWSDSDRLQRGEEEPAA